MDQDRALLRNLLKQKQIAEEKAANDYASKVHAAIKDVKALRGKTLLYHAFMAGAKWERDFFTNKNEAL